MFQQNTQSIHLNARKASSRTRAAIRRKALRSPLAIPPNDTCYPRTQHRIFNGFHQQGNASRHFANPARAASVRADQAHHPCEAIVQRRSMSCEEMT
jgi:hypothetical protein